MRLLPSIVFAVLGGLWATMPMAALAQTDAAKAFQRLQTLEGQWQGRFEDGRRHTVSYRLTAGGTVLVETWALGPGRESMTLYHLDGERLLATHFCPQGNQPRLQLVAGDDADELSFAFLDGSNLAVEGGSHQHTFWLRFENNDRYQRGETYVENLSSAAELAAAGKAEGIVYTRITAAPAGEPVE